MVRPINTLVAGDDIIASELNDNFDEIWDNADKGVILPLTYGETITAGNAVAIGDGLQAELVQGGDNSSFEQFTGTSNWFAQKFTTSSRTKSIKSIVFYGVEPGGPSSRTFTVSIRADSSGLPTGSDLGSVAATPTTLQNTETTLTATFSTPITVSPSTDYHFVIRVSATGTTRVFRDDTGSQGASESSNSGANWTAINGPFKHIVYDIDTEAGKIYQTDASVTGSRVNNFIGFAQESGVLDDSKLVQLVGVVNGLSGLTAGVKYYLSNTAGAISTSAGTISKEVGIAYSSTSLIK